MSLTLTVPTPDPVEDLTVETRPKHLKEWLDDLPLTNLTDVCRTLDDEIGALNRQKVAMETRLKLLELYRSVILKLLPAMEEQYVATRLPQPGKNRQMAEQARQLLMELANGYKIILLDYQNARITLGKGKIAVTAAQRAMSALSRILMICYQTYAPAPSGIWFEIHQIFRFAIEQDIANETVADEDRESSVNSGLQTNPVARTVESLPSESRRSRTHPELPGGIRWSRTTSGNRTNRQSDRFVSGADSQRQASQALAPGSGRSGQPQRHPAQHAGIGTCAASPHRKTERRGIAEKPASARCRQGSQLPGPAKTFAQELVSGAETGIQPDREHLQHPGLHRLAVPPSFPWRTRARRKHRSFVCPACQGSAVHLGKMADHQ